MSKQRPGDDLVLGPPLCGLRIWLIGSQLMMLAIIVFVLCIPSIFYDGGDVITWRQDICPKLLLPYGLVALGCSGVSWRWERRRMREGAVFMTTLPVFVGFVWIFICIAF